MSNYNSRLQSNNVDLQEILNTINELPEANDGIDLPTLTNEGTESDLLLGKELIDSNGNIVTGTIVTATQTTPTITVNANGLITATATQPSGYIVAGTKSATKQLAFQAAKTITPSTVEQIAVSSGYYTGGSVKVAPIPSEYVIPSGTVTISANGTHDVGNYKNAVVNVGSSGGNTDAEDGLVARTLTTYSNDKVTSIGSYAFAYYSKLTTVSFPVCTSIGDSAFTNCSSLKSVNFPTCTNISSYAFYYCISLASVSFPACTNIGGNAFYSCSNLTTVSFPVCTSIGSYAFIRCSKLTSVSFPVCTNIGSGAFTNCSNLTTVSFPVCTSIGSYAFDTCSNLTTISLPACTSIGSYAFEKCYRLSSVILDGSTRCTLTNSNAFSSTPFKGYSTYFSGTPYIYVPASLLNSYATATNWAYFSAYFSTIESLGLGGGSSGSTSGSTYSLG